MKKILVYLFIFSLIVTGCGTHTAQGAYTGSQVGSVLGSAIGGLSNGWRGRDVGTIAGLVGGAVVGGAIGNACDKAKTRKIEAKRAPERNDDHYDDSYVQNDRRMQNNRYESSMSSRDMGSAEMRNIMFYDADDNGILSPDEDAEIVFEVYNKSDETIYNVIPKVELTNKAKYIEISRTRINESIEPGHTKRFTFYIKTGRRLKNGRAAFCISVCNSSDILLAPKTEFEVETRR